MSGLCPAPAPDLGLLRQILDTVDCNSQAYAEVGFRALTGPQSVFPAIVTTLLTIYVALIGFRLLFGLGGARLSEAPLMAVQIGAILALTLSWNTFQVLVFDVAAKAPLQIAHVVTGPAATSGSALARDPLTGLQAVYDELTKDGIAFGRLAGPNALASRGGEAGAADALSKAAGALVASTVGVMAVAIIATGVLTAVGPVFILLFLFESTRGFFVGWIRALVAVALAPIVCWITTSVLLIAVEPWINDLARQREALNLSVDTATVTTVIILIFATGQAVLVVAGAIMASGFQLRLPRRAAQADAPAPRVGHAPPQEMRSRAQDLSYALERNYVVHQGGYRSTAGGSSQRSLVAGSTAYAETGGLALRVGESYRREGGWQSDRLRRRSGALR
jgi:type IV secretion system protein VirB6